MRSKSRLLACRKSLCLSGIILPVMLLCGCSAEEAYNGLSSNLASADRMGSMSSPVGDVVIQLEKVFWNIATPLFFPLILFLCGIIGFIWFVARKAKTVRKKTFVLIGFLLFWIMLYIGVSIHLSVVLC